MLTLPVNLPLNNSTLKKVDDTGAVMTVHLETTEDGTCCHECGCHTTTKHGNNEPRLIRHLPILGKPVMLSYSPCRYRCESTCSHRPTTTATPDWHHQNSGFTIEFERHVVLSLVNSTIADVMKKEDLTGDEIRGIIDRTIGAKFDFDSIDDLGNVGLDDVALKKGYKNFMTIVTSKTGDEITLIGVLKGRKKATVKAFLKKIPKRLYKTITCFCTDMHDGYVYAIKSIFKNKKLIIIDRFHVAKLYRGATDKFRMKIMAQLKKKLTDEEYNKIKHCMHLLRRGREYIDPNDKEKIHELFSHSEELSDAYKFCLDLTHIFNTHMEKAVALIKINVWIRSVKRSHLNCFDSFISTLKKYKNEIANYFIDRNSSGWVEGLNNKFKVLKRRCYGLFDVKTVFQRLHLDISGYRIFLENTDTYPTT